MGQGMNKGDWNEAARQIMKNDPPGTRIMISDTINHPHNGHTDGYEALKRPDGSIRLIKQHG